MADSDETVKDGEVGLAQLPPGDHECAQCGGSGRVSDPTVVVPLPYHKLERGWRKRRLLVELAKGEATLISLANVFECHVNAIYRFRDRHRDEIAAIQKRLEDEFAALWITRKVDRLAEYQQDVDDVNELVSARLAPREIDPLDPMTSAEGKDDDSASDLPNWLRIKHSALKAAAEELGEIPNRVSMDLGVGIVTYQLVGMNLDEV